MKKKELIEVIREDAKALQKKTLENFIEYARNKNRTDKAKEQPPSSDAMLLELLQKGNISVEVLSKLKLVIDNPALDYEITII